MALTSVPLFGAERLDLTSTVPDIIEFVTSDEYLARPNLYPRQATILKIIFLETELLTQYDKDVIKEWEKAYRETADEKGEGNNGIPSGTVDRMWLNRLCPCDHDRKHHVVEKNPVIQALISEFPEIGGTGCELCDCQKYEGRWYFREVISVIGRRGSKGHIGALASAYIIYRFIMRGDPQYYYGIDRDKRLQAIVFAGKKDQAKAHQWGDLNNVILGAPCFIEYISRSQGESLTLYSPTDQKRMERRAESGIQTTSDAASFEIIPKESTKIAGRGGASFLQIYDEAAHVVKGVANVPAEEVYEAATPALDQFGRDSFIYLPSSPWQRIGLFHDKYQQSIELGEDGKPAYPELMMFQLTSWDPYVDWEIAHELFMYPEGHPKEDVTFARLKGPIQSYDEDMRQIERANPETFAVERRSHFAAVLDAYLNPQRIADMWLPWPTEKDVLTMKDRGVLSHTYRAHGDPSKSGANFGFAIGHIAGRDERGLPHVVFDLIHNWDPADFPNHEVDYDEINKQLEHWLVSFMPSEMSFDQFNSVSTIQRLSKFAREKNLPKHVQVYERSATGPLNWKTYETFKTALGLGLVHAPFHELANMELTFLQDLGGKVDCPDAGPVQTKDVADCLAIVTYELIGDEMATLIGKSLGDIGVRGQSQGGINPYPTQTREDAHEKLSNFGRNRRPFRKV